jgi:citrate lyase subunit beta / citryl-CoA lyase
MTSSGASWLFVPGDRPERFSKAAGAGASEIIIDLEDAVGAASKDVARDAAAGWLTHGAASAYVRINAVETPWHQADLETLKECKGLKGVVVPKADHPDALTQIASLLQPDADVIALVETAAGVRDASIIAGAAGVSRVAFGSLDFAVDVDVDIVENEHALLFARSALVLASRAAGLPGPIDGVSLDVRNPKAVLETAQRSRGLGFRGMLCIHPSQVPSVERAFGVTAREIAWAREICAAAEHEADGRPFIVNGAMVDQPILKRARRILNRTDPRPLPPGP